MTIVSENSVVAQVRRRVDDVAVDLIGLSHEIHDLAEVAFDEHVSAEACRRLLGASGFEVADVPDLPTAFVARIGRGPRTVAVCCEYDALPDMGHACGHNVIAAAGVGAGLALQWLVDPATTTVLVVGCPAEEYGGGKALLLDAGVFTDVEAAVMVHPGDHDSGEFVSWAFVSLRVIVEPGPDAVDIAESLRAELKSGFYGARMGLADVTVDGAGAGFDIDLRTGTSDELRTERTRLESAVDRPGVTVRQLEPVYESFVSDERLVRNYTRHAQALGRTVVPARGPFAMTDMGNVSHVVPALHAMVDVSGGTHGPHSREFVAHARSERADRTVLDAATALAATLLSHLNHPSPEGSS